MKFQLLAITALCALASTTVGQSTTEATHANKPTATTASKKPAATSVSTAVKQTWCNENNQFCKNVCLNMTSSAATVNCDTGSLTYACTCKNGKSPDPNTYTFPVDYYKCTTSVQSCQSACKNGDAICQQNCQKDCSAINDPFAGNVTTEPTTTDAGDGSFNTATADIFDSSALLATANLAFVAGLAGLLTLAHQL
ncbi:hypothetical protein IWQ60_001055 [Tieghemiomyces parasiticus]|uniref:DUF7707 domain-containing protein n=1 Tax=Tieghemiomyces parasiticus TaxID=78921 RepID=A0A9W8AHC7_9FUNG|nr:hypothetical protein IWQ60_001055 [Tieghemiomyces parasiticus]